MVVITPIISCSVSMDIFPQTSVFQKTTKNLLICFHKGKVQKWVGKNV